MTGFERFQEYGRIRSIAKDVDPYSLTFEKDDRLKVALSTGQVIDAENFHHLRDTAVYGYISMIFTIGMDKRQQPLSYNEINTI